MPIIIWGSTNRTQRLNSGEFHCPRCDCRQGYSLEQVQSYFTLYFIPLFPQGSATRVVICQQCKQGYKEEVLAYKPPTDMERHAARIHNELRAGKSLQDLQPELMKIGMSADQAQRVLNHMCDGRPKTCRCGQSFHPDRTSCNRCGAPL